MANLSSHDGSTEDISPAMLGRGQRRTKMCRRAHACRRPLRWCRPQFGSKQPSRARPPVCAVRPFSTRRRRSPIRLVRTETFSINFDAADPESAFETEAVIDGIRELHLLSGSTLVTRDIDNGGPLCLWDLSDVRQEKLQLLNPSLLQVSPTTLLRPSPSLTPGPAR